MQRDVHIEVYEIDENGQRVVLGMCSKTLIHNSGQLYVQEVLANSNIIENGNTLSYDVDDEAPVDDLGDDE